MDDAGTVRAGVSAVDPYAHGFIGFQIAAPLYVQLRQTAETSNIFENADRLYPGMDVKLRLMEEGPIRPAMAVGLQSIAGHKRMAGEYATFSKRYKSFDFTSGIGWGRYASGGKLPNPFKFLNSHFDGRRELDGEMPSDPSDWFTGEHIGLFGGIEYFTPVNGLSVKFDVGQDRFDAERAAFDFNAPAPWSAGVSYKPKDFAEFSIGAMGTDKIMGRVTFSTNIQSWKGGQFKNRDSAIFLNPRRTRGASLTKAAVDAANDGMLLTGIHTKGAVASANLKLQPVLPAPMQIGEATIHIANNSPEDIERINVTPSVLGLKGPSISLLRRDFENVISRKQGSAEEIWRSAEFEKNPKKINFKKLRRGEEIGLGFKNFNLTLDQTLSLSEKDSGTLARTSVLAEQIYPLASGFLDFGYTLRLNLFSNLDNIRNLRPYGETAGRGDADAFAARRVSVDQSWIAFTHSLRPDLHAAIMAGYLEEMYGGAGGEVLYRPFGARYALGAEIWAAAKRDPLADMNMGFTGDHILTGHVNGWYDVPGMDVTLNAKIGCYLAGDFGAGFGLKKTFRGGAALEGFVTVTDMADFDEFGGTTHAASGLRMTLPLGGFKYVTDNTILKIRSEPVARIAGQSIEKPLSLYEATDQFSYSHITHEWQSVLP